MNFRESRSSGSGSISDGSGFNFFGSGSISGGSGSRVYFSKFPSELGSGSGSDFFFHLFLNQKVSKAIEKKKIAIGAITSASISSQLSKLDVFIGSKLVVKTIFGFLVIFPKIDNLACDLFWVFFVNNDLFNQRGNLLHFRLFHA